MSQTEKAPIDLKQRTKGFALRVIRLYSALPKTIEAQVIGKQLLRSGTSVGGALPRGEFISKLAVGLQELEESAYWFELLVDLQEEAEELTAILVTCVKNAKTKGRKDEGGRMKDEG